MAVALCQAQHFASPPCAHSTSSCLPIPPRAASEDYAYALERDHRPRQGRRHGAGAGGGLREAALARSVLSSAGAGGGGEPANLSACASVEGLSDLGSLLGAHMRDDGSSTRGAERAECGAVQGLGCGAERAGPGTVWGVVRSGGIPARCGVWGVVWSGPVRVRFKVWGVGLCGAPCVRCVEAAGLSARGCKGMAVHFM